MSSFQNASIRRGLRFAGVPLMVACALLAAGAAHAQPGGPLEAAVRFIEIRQVSHCGKLWPLYSAGTQENIRAAWHRNERERHGLPQAWKPEEHSCGRDGTLKRGSARLVRQESDEAQGIFSPERMAEAVLGLENAARKSAP